MSQLVERYTAHLVKSITEAFKDLRQDVSPLGTPYLDILVKAEVVDAPRNAGVSFGGGLLRLTIGGRAVTFSEYGDALPEVKP